MLPYNIIAIRYRIYSMENPCKSFQIAYSYQDYVRNSTGHRSSNMASLPSSIPEEQDSTWQIAEQRPENIFHFRGHSKSKKIDLLPTKRYECVGFKQFQAYVTKAEKKKRQRMNSLLKRNTSESVLSYSRASQSKISEKQYLTKDEVIRLYGTENNRQSVSQFEETYVSNEKSIIGKSCSTQNTTLGSCLYTPQQTLRNSSNHEFSLTRLKQRLNNYKEEWDRQLSRKKLCLSHNRNKTVKLDSIIQNSELFRKKMQKLELNSIRQANQHLQPKMWALMLRNQKPIDKTAAVQKVLKKGLGCSGKNKLSKEINWIQEKDKLGFCFKGKREAKQNIYS